MILKPRAAAIVPLERLSAAGSALPYTTKAAPALVPPWAYHTPSSTESAAVSTHDTPYQHPTPHLLRQRPQPPPLPPGEPQAGSSGSARVQSTGEFDGVRAYLRGDPIKAVVWKKAAQAFAAGRDELVSRDALSTQRQELWLDHAQCGHSGLEARLSRLTAWVLQADRLDLVFGLRLPGREIPPDSGPSHRARCLEALAIC